MCFPPSVRLSREFADLMLICPRRWSGFHPLKKCLTECDKLDFARPHGRRTPSGSRDYTEARIKSTRLVVRRPKTELWLPHPQQTNRQRRQQLCNGSRSRNPHPGTFAAALSSSNTRQSCKAWLPGEPRRYPSSITTVEPGETRTCQARA